MPRDLKPCGTDAAYRRHLKHGEEACEACKAAHAAAAAVPGAIQREVVAELIRRYPVVYERLCAKAVARRVAARARAAALAGAPMREPHPIITRLVALREVAGLSRAAVARQIRYACKSVEYWEAGKSEPRVDAVDAYARVVGHRLVLGDSDSPIAVVLKQARLNAGLAQADVARKLGCSLNSVCRWETGDTGITLTKATEYAGLFGLELRLAEVLDV